MIFTNQGNIKGAMNGTKADFVRKRIDAFAEKVGVPMQAFAATQNKVSSVYKFNQTKSNKQTNKQV